MIEIFAVDIQYLGIVAEDICQFSHSLRMRAGDSLDPSLKAWKVECRQYDSVREPLENGLHNAKLAIFAMIAII